MLFFVQHGYRVIAHDRRGHGRSSQGGEGHDMDHYADDLAAVTALLDVHDAIHVGHSTGGGEVVRYIARHGESRVAKAVLISAVPPLMVQTEANPGGTVRNYCKGGANAGVSGVVRYYPIDQLDVVVLSNSADGAWPAIDEIHRLIRAENPSVGASGAGFR